MADLREAAQVVLNALVHGGALSQSFAIEQLSAALAEQENSIQENVKPVAWYWEIDGRPSKYAYMGDPSNLFTEDQIANAAKHNPPKIIRRLWNVPPQRELEKQSLCACGQTSTLGVVHRKNAPCYRAEEQMNYNSTQTQQNIMMKYLRNIMLQHLQLMIAREDWHGVADAAMDLREMDAESRHQN